MKPRCGLDGGCGRGSLMKLLSSCGPGSSEGLTGAEESASKFILVVVGRGLESLDWPLHKALLQWGSSRVTAAKTEVAVSFMTELWT